MRIILIIAMAFLADGAQAQISRVSLQASGLTCSMCSKAVKEALEEVSFVDKVQVDIKNQQYNLSFKEGADADFDALSKAVEDAGFSVASFRVTAQVNGLEVKKDDHVRIGSKYFHFLNTPGRVLDGTVTFNVVDKGFVGEREHKKLTGKSKHACVQTGKAAACCTEASVPGEARIFHVVI